MEPTTREKHTYYLRAFIHPVLSQNRMAEIFPEHIRERITQMQREGQSAWTIQYCKTSILSSIFTTALNDKIIYIHPGHGVRIPTVPASVRSIITPEQFDMLYPATLRSQFSVQIQLRRTENLQITAIASAQNPNREPTQVILGG